MKEEKDVLLSVVMPMYNSSEYIAEALESLQRQSFSDFEVIIVDNCSADNSVEIVNGFNDQRFHVYINDENRGLLYSLQRGVSLARGKYIARLDSDDVSYERRFEKQLEFMEKNPDVMLCGCRSDAIIDGKTVSVKEFPIFGCDAISFSLLYADFCITHSSFMFRRKGMEDAGIAYEKFQHCQDYHMLLSVVKENKVAMLSEILVGYRMHSEQLTATDDKQFVKGEEYEIREIYANHIGLGEQKKAILFKALDKELCGMRDVFLFQELMNEHAKLIDVDINKKGTNEYLCAQFVFWYICTMQRIRNMKLLISYIRSPYRKLKWLLGNKYGFMWGICCILGYNTRGL